MNGWRTIDSAPKDGLMDIWLAEGRRLCNCYYDHICGEWRTSAPAGRLVTINERFVTHWMPLPTPPTD